MNHCESYEPLLDAFTEGDLFMEDMVRVQQHLINCPHCQAYVEDLLAMRAAFPTVAETEVPAGFTASVMAAVAATPQATAPAAASAAKSAKKRTPWTKVLSGLAACCAIVLLAQGGLNMGGGASMAPKAEEAAAPMEMYTADSAHAESAMEAPAEEAKMAEPQTEAAPESDIVHDETSVEHTTTGGVAGAPSPYRIIVTVDAEWVGDALYHHLPLVEYDETPAGSDTLVHIREYELTMAEYDELFSQLALERGEAPVEEGFDTNSEMVLVIVRQ